MVKQSKVFLDTNFYIDIVKRKKGLYENFEQHMLYISPFSTSIMFYLYKINIPNEKYNSVKDRFGIIPFTKQILDKSLHGPTKDIEDNIQLHSAAEASCKYFLTNDKKLLKMKYFGKVEIVNSL